MHRGGDDREAPDHIVDRRAADCRGRGWRSPIGTRVRRSRRTQLVLYGNVDLRQVDLAFNGSERIAAVLVQEGDRVHKGAGAGPARHQPPRAAVAKAKAQAAAQKAAVRRLHNGSRPEEIAQARANVASAKADAENARV